MVMTCHGAPHALEAMSGQSGVDGVEGLGEVEAEKYAVVVIGGRVQWRIAGNIPPGEGQRTGRSIVASRCGPLGAGPLLRRLATTRREDGDGTKGVG